MAQQTQMERVVEYQTRWLTLFPDIRTLADGPEDLVLKCWEGLGYYSRARNILKTAKILIEQYGGKLPQKKRELENLPGIGPYTAAAICSIAFNQDVALVDANVERLFARIFAINLLSGSPELKQECWQLAKQLLPQGHARNFNQALMELGALICRPKAPLCTKCPVAGHCLAQKNNLVSTLPLPKKKKQTIAIEMATGILVHKGKLFIQQREANDVWGGLWEFPGGRMEQGETSKETVQREYLEETEFQVQVNEKITTTIHHYTKYKVSLHCFWVTLAQPESEPVLHAAQQFQWIPFAKIAKYAFPAGHRKLIEFIKEQKLL